MDELIEAGRAESVLRLHASLNHIISKYSHPFQNTDVLDLESEEIVEDHGTLRNLEPQRFGSFTNTSAPSQPSVLEILMGQWSNDSLSECESGADHSDAESIRSDTSGYAPPSCTPITSTRMVLQEAERSTSDDSGPEEEAPLSARRCKLGKRTARQRLEYESDDGSGYEMV